MTSNSSTPALGHPTPPFTLTEERAIIDRLFAEFRQHGPLTFADVQRVVRLLFDRDADQERCSLILLAHCWTRRGAGRSACWAPLDSMDAFRRAAFRVEELISTTASSSKRQTLTRASREPRRMRRFSDHEEQLAMKIVQRRFDERGFVASSEVYRIIKKTIGPVTHAVVLRILRSHGYVCQGRGPLATWVKN